MQKVASFWYTKLGNKGISQLEILCIKSWLDNGFEFNLYTYNLDDKIFNYFKNNFSNFKLQDANEIIKFEDMFSDDRGVGVAGFSDYFRFKMIYITGIPWVDLDMICLNNFSMDNDFIIIKEKLKNKDKFYQSITTSLLKFPKKSEFGKYLIKESEKLIDNRKVIPWGIIGPVFLNDACIKFGLDKIALDYKETCQVSCYEVEKFVLKNTNLDISQKCLHLYNEMWRGMGINKNNIYNKNSIYEKLKNKYRVYEILDDLNLKSTKNYLEILKILWKFSKIRVYVRNPKRILKTLTLRK
ncbi:hypothetical protein [Campylobacter sp. RM12637]|uniref:hypothetical protein n=1 Tax=Campylobacter sp. RM12637 TaxID=2735734 RepID=UPI0030158172|nr:hypothetical protein [Campylobacter sp. RM12637]